MNLDPFEFLSESLSHCSTEKRVIYFHPNYHRIINGHVHFELSNFQVSRFIDLESSRNFENDVFKSAILPRLICFVLFVEMQFSCPFPPCTEKLKYSAVEFHSHVAKCYGNWSKAIGLVPLCVCASCEGKKCQESGPIEKERLGAIIGETSKRNSCEYFLQQITSSKDPRVIYSSSNFPIFLFNDFSRKITFHC